MSQTATEFPEDVLARAEHEIYRYGDMGFEAMVQEIYFARREPYADDLMAAVDAIGWANRIKFRKRDKIIRDWLWIVETDDKETRPWKAIPDDPEI